MEQLRFLETHGDIFVGGKNHGKKHRPTPNLKLEWDDSQKCAFLTWNGERGRIPESNINVSVAGEPAKLPKNEHKTSDVNEFKKAQVETPMSHVFEGRGRGKTRS